MQGIYYRTSILSAAAALFFLAACGSHDHGNAGPDEDACEHMQAGPANAVTAAATGASAPNVSAAHTRHDIALVDVAGGKGGNVSYTADEDNEFVFALNKVLSFALRFGDSVISPESSKSTGFPCAEVKVTHTYDLEPGTYTLGFGPTSETSVSLVAVEAGHGH